MTRLTSETKSPHAASRRNHSPWRDRPDIPESIKLLFLVLAGLVTAASAFFFNTPAEIWKGNLKILTSPANLLTDYIELSNMGSTFFNAGVMALISVATIKLARAEITGVIVAGVFTLMGFSFFGKNLFNSIPIILGVALFAKLARRPMKTYLVQATFGTALGPLVSEITFNLGLPPLPAVLLGAGAGVLTGLVLPPLSEHFVRFHKGFSLYNVGFTAGIIGMFFLAVLRSFDIEVLPVSVLSSGNNLRLGIWLFSLFAAVLVFGLYCARWSLRGYKNLMAQPGTLGSDFIGSAGFGLTAVNMAVLGALMTAYVLLMKGELNGPTIGGIFTVFSFGAFGKHIRNVVPIICGVFIANLLNIHEASSTVALLSALFGTTLAPVAGVYGFGWGAMAGFLHMAVTMNTCYLHGGMNLYNNGFSGGFVAAALIPLIEKWRSIRKHGPADAQEPQYVETQAGGRQ